MSSHLPMLAHLEIIAPDDSHRHDFCSHLAFDLLKKATMSLGWDEAYDWKVARLKILACFESLAILFQTLRLFQCLVLAYQVDYVWSFD